MRYRHTVPRLTITMLLLACWAVPASSAVIYVRQHAGPEDGTSWATAWNTVEEGIGDAAASDQVWVAQGTYSENLFLSSGIALYGGFAGTETQLSQRNWRTNITVLDGRRTASVIEIVKDATSATRVDGFTITRGRAVLGGGIYMGYRAVPVIANNYIVENSATCDGGGIYCNLDCNPVIADCRVYRNTATVAGGGIRTTTGGAVVTNCLVVGNSALNGGGIYCGESSAVSHEDIVNNTIFANTANTGGGIYCTADSAASIDNNIIPFNSSGIRKDSGAGTAAVHYNCVYGNAFGNYSGITQGGTDIVQDPVLASGKCGNLHIQPTSPCKEHGSNSYVIGGYSDIDGQTRIQGTVDMGADESDGTTWTVTPRIVRVSPDGSDGFDGSTWVTPKATIQAAVEHASQVGGEVWVRQGTYNERVAMRDFVYVYGGFAGSETSLSQRDWKANPTTINGQSAGSTVTAKSLGHRISALDGFTVTGGKAYNGGGICCEGASPQIANNTVTGNSTDNKGGGIYLDVSSALVQGNTVLGNGALTAGGGIFSDRSCAEILANSIDGNSASLYGCGIGFSSDNASLVVSNKILRNAEESTLGDAWGGAVSVGSYGAPTLTNNTLIYNTASYAGVYSTPYGTLNLNNNIVGFNSSGIRADSAVTTSGSHDNCVHGNTAFNYQGYAGSAGDITSNPLFVAPYLDDYRVRHTSACIDGGYDSAVQTSWTDFDGNPRKTGLHVDIGCFEYNGIANDMDTISRARALPDGLLIRLSGKPITAAFTGAFYIEEPDRTAGMRILSGQGVTPGQFVTVVGTTTLDNGERAVSATSVSPASGDPDDVPLTLVLISRSLGGGDYFYNLGGEVTGQQGITGADGLNNIGLLVTVLGVVSDRDTAPSPTWFRVDDGSMVSDDSGQPGVKVLANGLTVPQLGDFVNVTGSSSCLMAGSDLHRQLRAVEITVLD